MSSLSPLQQAQQANQQYRDEQMARLEHARQESTQEKFEIKVFGQWYDLHDNQGELHISSERIQGFEREYYLDHPEIMTIQEFATHRRKRDAEQAG